MFALNLRYIVYFLLLIFVFSKEILVINEEFLIILSFLAVFFGLKNALSDVVITELTDRNNLIKKQFLSLYDNKKHFKNNLLNILNKKIVLERDFSNYSDTVTNNMEKLLVDRNIICNEILNIYTEQLLSTYLVKYNFELKNTYLEIINGLAVNSNITSK